MNIYYIDSYRLETSCVKVDGVEDIYSLTLTKIDTVENTTSCNEYFFEFAQLKAFVEYLNKAVNDCISTKPLHKEDTGNRLISDIAEKT